jgi:rhamnosyltransferase
MSDPRVTLVMRSFNEGWALKETLPAVAAQEFRDWQLIVIDSGSTDGSVELIRAARPARFIQILPHEYRPGRVMNQGMELADTESVIFLNADATPQGSNWLRPLVESLQDPKTAAVFGRQIARPDCQAVFAADYDRCFGERRESDRWDHFFSMVSSGLRKDIWSRRGFLESMQYSEDDEYTRWAKAQGYAIVYRPDSVVMHSHNYTPRQAYKRSFGEAWALAAVWSSDPENMTRTRKLYGGWLNDVRKDFAYCRQTGRLKEWSYAAKIRWAQRLGQRDGFKAGWSMHGARLVAQPTRPLASSDLSVPTPTAA